jgi:SAM-dependent methyltransferase
MSTLAFDAATSSRIETLYATPDAVRRRDAVRRMLDPRPGERVLDVGCGPGFLASEIAVLVGAGGAVHAVDQSESMLTLARRRCAAQPWVTIERGEAAGLVLPDESFDAALSVQVLEYVSDVEAALRSLFRALRPGGRLLLVDTDWASLVCASADAARMQRVLAAFDEHLADPHLPRRLPHLLVQAGFAAPRCEVLVPISTAFEADSFGAGIVELIHRFVPGRRGVTQAEADAWIDELRERSRRGLFFFSLNQYFFVAGRP